jgi:hypothetical protein
LHPNTAGVALAKSLQSNRTNRVLREVQLNSNKLSDGAAIALADALARCSFLNHGFCRAMVSLTCDDGCPAILGFVQKFTLNKCE